MTDDIQPFMEVIECNAVGKCKVRPGDYQSHGAYYSTPTKKQTAARALQELEAARKKDVEQHEKNGPALAHNQALKDRLTEIMKAAGIPDTYSRPKPRSRSWPPKRERVDAGYLGDIKRNIITNDGFYKATATYNKLKADYDKFADEAEVEAVEAAKAVEREAELKKKERLENIALAQIIMRYEFPEDIDWPEVLEELRKKDQYLDLAIAGMATRGDWSDGYYRVQDAFNRFMINDDRDKEIAADIMGCLGGQSDFVDGRVFRDTNWNYDKLLTLVPEQLRTDAILAYNKCSMDI